jgi:ABC-2 type transport system ATP-binding protein
LSAVIDARELGRWYGPVVGLNELTASIGAGVTGLVGPNGAGKSTFMKLVAGELLPSRGALSVLGEAPFANRELFRRVGFCPQQDALWGHMSGRAFLTLLMRLAGFARREARARADRALERVGLSAAADRRTAEYSKGMRQRAKIAQAIAHAPELLVVDEPMTGLDPVARLDTLTLFRELAEAGVHIVISSHVLHEVESLTEEILLVHRGRLLAQGAVRDVRRLLARHPRRVEIRAREPRRLARALIELEDVAAVEVTGDDGLLLVETRDLDGFLERLTRIAAAESFGVRELESTDASLEAVFDYLVQ